MRRDGEDEDVVTPCTWCHEPDDNDCRCYAATDDEEYER